MKFYFFTHIKTENFTPVGTFNDVTQIHPIDVIITWNKSIENNGSNIFYTLVFFTEISKERYDLYKANEKYI